MRAQLEAKPLGWRRQNFDPAKSVAVVNRAAPPVAVEQGLRAGNGLDLALYDFATAMVTARIKDHGRHRP
jgi:hypothetical protein